MAASMRLQDVAVVEAELRAATQRHQDAFCLYLLGVVLCDRQVPLLRKTYPSPDTPFFALPEIASGT